MTIAAFMPGGNSVTKREVHLSGKSGTINACIHTRLSGWQFLSGMGRDKFVQVLLQEKGSVCVYVYVLFSPSSVVLLCPQRCLLTGRLYLHAAWCDSSVWVIFNHREAAREFPRKKPSWPNPIFKLCLMSSFPDSLVVLKF